jgi:hypothetical protein
MKFTKYIIKNKDLSPSYLIHLCLKLEEKHQGLHQTSSGRGEGGLSPLAPPLAPCMVKDEDASRRKDTLGPCLVPQTPEFGTIQKENFPSHQICGTCMKY